MKSSKMIPYNTPSIRRYLSIMKKEARYMKGNFIERRLYAPLYACLHKAEMHELSNTIVAEVRELC